MAEGLPGAPVQSRVTPGLIVRLATSFMATRHLIAAVEVGLFEALGDDALDLDALAARIAVPRRTARICADAMVALGLLERAGPVYRNGAVAGAYLTDRGAGDLRPFVRYADLSYRAWADSYEFGRAWQRYCRERDPDRLFGAKQVATSHDDQERP